MDASYAASRESLNSQLATLERAQINPEIYADEKMEAERVRASAPEFIAPASGSTLNIIAKWEASKQNLQNFRAKREKEEAMHSRLVEAIAREELGMPNEFYPEAKKTRFRPEIERVETPRCPRREGDRSTRLVDPYEWQ
jgi:hypothetical protein